MMYHVIIQSEIDVEAETSGEAIDKAALEATFGTDFYGISLVSVDKIDNE